MGWFKLWDDEWLEKNKEKDLALQGAMVRLLCVANVSFDNGRFTHRGKVGLSNTQIMQMADIDEKMWLRTVEAGFIAQQSDVWLIPDWSKYQSEYERKKGYVRKSNDKKPIKKDRAVGQVIETSKSPHLDVKDSKDVKDVIEVKEVTEGKDGYQGKDSPHVDTFISWFCQEFKGRFNEPYLVSKDKDISAAKELLGAFGLEKTKSLAIAGWESKRDFQVTRAKSISGLVSIANELATKKENKKRESKYGSGKVVSL